MQGRRIRVRGQVQGVGFRPFIWQLAQRFGVKGEVLNDPEGVLIFAFGESLDDFEAAISSDAPLLARVDAVESEPAADENRTEFVISKSQGSGAETRVTPDAATCPDCLAEIHDPNDRRFGYAFANCTHCGPRFTILHQLPYDRSQTTMAEFAMCPECQAEYADPADRRFHAQPVACPACGPKVWLEPRSDQNPISEAADRLLAGEILAIKGLGGFHLSCDATNAQAVQLLRERKRRPGKPFALMTSRDILLGYATASESELALLADPSAPIVLLDNAGSALPEGIAPGQACLGWMLPYTPLHHLLIEKIGRPLVMTSGNLSGEPQVIDNDEAKEKLGAFADAFLLHDRAIARRLDDSVERVLPSGPMVLRRARGRVPGTLPLPDGFEDAPQLTGYGGQMKAAICLIKNGQALLGHHLGELDELLTWEAFQQADRDYADLFDHKPELVACDLHPDFRATKHAESKGLPVAYIQHHHAHLASCLAENGWPLHGGKVAGIILDGLGLGPDGTVWGGEVLLGDYTGYERKAWLKPAPLIGGDKASVEPWRNALVRLDAAGQSEIADVLFAGKALDMARAAARAGLNSPLSSSAGRLFDAFAAAIGICADAQSYEGEAAMRLEALARQPNTTDLRAIEFVRSGGEIDPFPLFSNKFLMSADRAHQPEQSWLFHDALARAFAAEARELINTGQAKAVVLSGGCFQNALLLERTLQALRGVPVLAHHKTPSNDGSLALGQAVIAAAQVVTG